MATPGTQTTHGTPGAQTTHGTPGTQATRGTPGTQATRETPGTHGPMAARRRVRRRRLGHRRPGRRRTPRDAMSSASGPVSVVVLEGDQTGQELLEQSLRVLDPDLL